MSMLEHSELLPQRQVFEREIPVALDQ